MVFTLALLCLATASSVSPVQKVIQLLDDLKGKVQADLDRETKLMEEYAHCQSWVQYEHGVNVLFKCKGGGWKVQGLRAKM